MDLYSLDGIGFVLLPERREKVEHVEAFIVENIIMNAGGFYVPAGYKK